MSDLAELQKEIRNADAVVLDQDMVNAWAKWFARIEGAYQVELSRLGSQCPPENPDWGAWAGLGPQPRGSMTQSMTSSPTQVSQLAYILQEPAAERREERDGSPTPRGRGESNWFPRWT